MKLIGICVVIVGMIAINVGGKSVVPRDSTCSELTFIAGADGNIGTRCKSLQLSPTMMMITQSGADFKYDTIFPHDPATGDSWASVLL
jgi:hypothetical protein